MTNPLLPDEIMKQINDQAAHYAQVHYGDPAKYQGTAVVIAYDNGLEDFSAGAEHYASLWQDAERRCRESSELLNPILDWGQNSPELKLGTSITKEVLRRAKAFNKLKSALEEIMHECVGDAWEIAREALESLKEKGGDGGDKA